MCINNLAPSGKKNYDAAGNRCNNEVDVHTDIAKRNSKNNGEKIESKKKKIKNSKI